MTRTRIALLVALLIVGSVFAADVVVYHAGGAGSWVGDGAGNAVWVPGGGPVLIGMILEYLYPSGLTNASGLVEDSSGAGNHGVPGAGAAQPTWYAASNSMSAFVYHDGGDTVSSTPPQTVSSLSFWAAPDNDGRWNLYENSAGTTYINGTAATFAVNTFANTGANMIVWGQSYTGRLARERAHDFAITPATNWNTEATNFNRIPYLVTNLALWSNSLFAFAGNHDPVGLIVDDTGYWRSDFVADAAANKPFVYGTGALSWLAFNSDYCFLDPVSSNAWGVDSWAMSMWIRDAGFGEGSLFYFNTMQTPGYFDILMRMDETPYIEVWGRKADSIRWRYQITSNSVYSALTNEMIWSHVVVGYDGTATNHFFYFDSTNIAQTWITTTEKTYSFDDAFSYSTNLYSVSLNAVRRYGQTSSVQGLQIDDWMFIRNTLTGAQLGVYVTNLYNAGREYHSP